MTNHTVASRRIFLKTTALAGAALAGGSVLDQVNSVAEDAASPASGKLKIKIAGYQYDRVAGLIDGRVQVDRCEAQFETGRISPSFELLLRRTGVPTELDHEVAQSDSGQKISRLRSPALNT